MAEIVLMVWVFTIFTEEIRQVWRKYHKGNTKTPTSALDQVFTAQNGCQLRITAFDLAISVSVAGNIGCRPR